ncbi:MAG: histidine phosphatase family protein [Actinomycetes bacterium]
MSPNHMTKVYVLRHAKAEKQGDTDHARALNEKGGLQCAALGTWIAEAGITFDVVVVSAATRTQETLEGLGLESGAIEVSKAAYNSDAETLTRLIQESGAVDSVLIIAHNPGVTDLCALAGHGAELKTCTLVELECPTPISEFNPANCTVSRVVQPEV